MTSGWTTETHPAISASAVPVLPRPERPWKECVFSQYPRKGPNGKRVMGYSMRTDRFRYTEWRLPDGQVDSAELYDHTADPRETRNVVHLAGYCEDMGRLSDMMRRGWRAALPASKTGG